MKTECCRNRLKAGHELSRPMDYCTYYGVIDNEKGKDWVLQKLNVTINFLENIRERQLKRLSHTIGNTTA